jgi:hypothetical protein
VADCHAVDSEFLLVPALEAFDAMLRARYRVAGRCRDAEALQRSCLEIPAETNVRMLAGSSYRYRREEPQSA